MTIPDRPTAELTALAGRLFDLETTPVKVGQIAVQFTKVRDPDQVLDQACERESSGLTGQRVPYWAAVWESAQGVVGQILESKWIEPGTTVLDLGCGMGLAGLLLAEAGMSVTMVDYEEEALMVARINASRVGADLVKSLPKVGLCDWQTDRLGVKFGSIVGSDVLYDREQWEGLDRFWREHLDTAGQVILGEPMRPKADEFEAWVSSKGWQVMQVIVNSIAGKPIRVFRVKSG
jgi:predicted nicotinamide N-methyase